MLDDRASTTVYSTDNSIYQVRPSGVAVPRDVADVRSVLVDNATAARPLPVVARGGGTGTNGQSLTDGVVIDLKRRMHRVLDLDVEARTVTVEPGIVAAELNARLARHDLFWPPHTSTMNRATVGGMIATDAAGKGSLIHGRTHRHVASVEALLGDGTPFSARPTSLAQARALAEVDDVVGRVWASLLRIADDVRKVDLELPELARGFSGYGLDRLVAADGSIDPVALLCGAEGTLGVITQATLRLAPIPAHTLLVVASYATFGDALDDAVALAPLTSPDAIESFDETTLERGRSSPAWPALGSVVGDHRGSVLLLEYSGDTMPDAEPILEALASTGRRLDAKSITDAAERAAAWKVRADAVGLLAKVATGGPRRSARPIAFVEDCAVPVANMPSFIAEFRSVLDAAGVTYGMFGHADVGCVHVRPALDLTDAAHVVLVQSITDDVVELVAKHGGVLWGEHGRGFRGESVDRFLSAPTIDLMRAVKTTFDPLDRLNPGKLYRPFGSDAPIVGVGEPALRGDRDVIVPRDVRHEFGSAFACNGNGLCHHYDGAEVMCPSYKATGDPALSPKGRADLVRDWLAGEGDPDFDEVLADNLHQCLSCSACTGHCPVEVDIPELKSRFLERYYERERRPIAHSVLARFERLVMLGGSVPSPIVSIGQRLAPRLLGLVDLPAPEGAIAHVGRAFDEASPPDVVVLPDAFSAGLQPSVIAGAISALEAVGFDVAVAPFVPSGKFDHVKGRRAAFERAVGEQRRLVERIARTGARAVVIEPATGLMHGHEYPAMDSGHPVDAVWHLVELLAERRDRIVPSPSPQSVLLLGHCTERSMRPDLLDLWRGVLEVAGHGVSAPDLGCCGMAGIFGHEIENQEMSRDLWDLSWQPVVDDMAGPGAVLVATGYSCRSQAKRFGQASVRHPVTLLANDETE